VLDRSLGRLVEAAGAAAATLPCTAVVGCCARAVDSAVPSCVRLQVRGPIHPPSERRPQAVWDDEEGIFGSVLSTRAYLPPSRQCHGAWHGEPPCQSRDGVHRIRIFISKTRPAKRTSAGLARRNSQPFVQSTLSNKSDTRSARAVGWLRLRLRLRL
jgi:hypothetical protein